MPVTYDASVKAARLTATRDQFADGTLELLTAADVVIVAFGLTGSGGSVAGDVWTIGLDAGTVAAVASGVVTKAQVKTSSGQARLTGLTVGMAGSGADVIVQNTNIVAGQAITLTSATVTHAA